MVLPSPAGLKLPPPVGRTARLAGGGGGGGGGIIVLSCS